MSQERCVGEASIAALLRHIGLLAIPPELQAPPPDPAGETSTSASRPTTPRPAPTSGHHRGAHWVCASASTQAGAACPGCSAL